MLPWVCSVIDHRRRQLNVTKTSLTHSPATRLTLPCFYHILTLSVIHYHSILLQKLDHHGIRGNINDWFASYLLGRSQGSNLSTECMTSCGVPQESVLGPLLFVIYINDIHYSSAKFSFFLFTDDTNLLYADINLSSLKETCSKSPTVLMQIS